LAGNITKPVGPKAVQYIINSEVRTIDTGW